MVKTPSQKREDEILLRMLKTPPKPHGEAKPKSSDAPQAPGSKE